MSGTYVLVLFLVIPLALVVAAIAAIVAVARPGRGLPEGYAGLRHLRRVAGVSRLLAVGLGVVAFYAAGQLGELGSGWLLAPTAAGVTALLCLAAGEVAAGRAATTPGVAALEVRTLQAHLPRGLAGATVAALVALVALLALGAATASPDDQGRAGRALAWTCGPDASATAGPWPGSFYGVPIAGALALGALVALIAYAAALRRPRNGSDPQILAVDDALRRSAVASITAVAALTLGTTLLGISFTMGSALGGSSSGTCPLSGPLAAAAPVVWLVMAASFALVVWGAVALARASRTPIPDAAAAGSAHVPS